MIIPSAYTHCRRWCVASARKLDRHAYAFVQVVLADKYEKYKMTYSGCHVFNPGSFIGKSFVFSIYHPTEISSEEG